MHSYISENNHRTTNVQCITLFKWPMEWSCPSLDLRHTRIYVHGLKSTGRVNYVSRNGSESLCFMYMNLLSIIQTLDGKVNVNRATA